MTGVDLHFDCQSICCLIILNHQADEKVPEARSRCRRRTPGTSRHLWRKHMVLYSSLIPQAGEKVPEAKSRCRRRTSGTSRHLRWSIWCFIDRLELFAREERPYHRNNDQGYDEAYDYETAFALETLFANTLVTSHPTLSQYSLIIS